MKKKKKNELKVLYGLIKRINAKTFVDRNDYFIRLNGTHRDNNKLLIIRRSKTKCFIAVDVLSFGGFPSNEMYILKFILLK